MIRVAVVGASGYTGAELLRILWAHPEMEVVVATANRYAGESISSLYPSLKGFYEFKFVSYDGEHIASSCDVAFLALPHGQSMKIVPDLLESGIKVVDLSADFRFRNTGTFEAWYGIRHSCPELLEESVYGLTEVFRENVKKARLVANPGCYPTCALIGIYPLARRSLIEGTVFVDAKSGISGAGRKASLDTHFSQASDSISPYSVGGHRHLPEMEGVISEISPSGPVDLVFTPHLVPMNRGILCTVYLPLREEISQEDLTRIYEEDYSEEVFIDVLPNGFYPRTKALQGSNRCHLSVLSIQERKTALVIAAIDNLVKGASGQAVQNMNLMCGLAEDTGLQGPGLFP